MSAGFRQLALASLRLLGPAMVFVISWPCFSDSSTPIFKVLPLFGILVLPTAASRPTLRAVFRHFGPALQRLRPRCSGCCCCSAFGSALQSFAAFCLALQRLLDAEIQGVCLFSASAAFDPNTQGVRRFSAIWPCLTAAFRPQYSGAVAVFRLFGPALRFFDPDIQGVCRFWQFGPALQRVFDPNIPAVSAFWLLYSGFSTPIFRVSAVFWQIDPALQRLSTLSCRGVCRFSAYGPALQRLFDPDVPRVLAAVRHWTLPCNDLPTPILRVEFAVGILALLGCGISTPIFWVTVFWCFGPTSLTSLRLLDPDDQGTCCSPLALICSGFSTPIFRVSAVFRHFGPALFAVFRHYGPAYSGFRPRYSACPPFFGIRPFRARLLCNDFPTPILRVFVVFEGVCRFPAFRLAWRLLDPDIREFAVGILALLRCGFSTPTFWGICRLSAFWPCLVRRVSVFEPRFTAAFRPQYSGIRPFRARLLCNDSPTPILRVFVVFEGGCRFPAFRLALQRLFGPRYSGSLPLAPIFWVCAVFSAVWLCFTEAFRPRYSACLPFSALALLCSGFSTPIFRVVAVFRYIGPTSLRLLDPDDQGARCSPSALICSPRYSGVVAIFRHFGAALQRPPDPNCSGRLPLFGLGPASQWLYDPNIQAAFRPRYSGYCRSSTFGPALQWLFDPNMQGGICRFSASGPWQRLFVPDTQGGCRFSVFWHCFAAAFDPGIQGGCCCAFSPALQWIHDPDIQGCLKIQQFGPACFLRYFGPVLQRLFDPDIQGVCSAFRPQCPGCLPFRGTSNLQAYCQQHPPQQHDQTEDSETITAHAG
eukprot:gene7297-biopygen145